MCAVSKLFKGIRFPERTVASIQRYAFSRNLNFSEAVIELCERSLNEDYDKGFAPHVDKVIVERLDRQARIDEQNGGIRDEQMLNDISEEMERLALRLEGHINDWGERTLDYIEEAVR